MHDDGQDAERRLRGKNRALLVVLLAYAGLMFAVSFVRMSEVEERRHERLADRQQMVGSQ